MNTKGTRVLALGQHVPCVVDSMPHTRNAGCRRMPGLVNRRSISNMLTSSSSLRGGEAVEGRCWCIDSIMRRRLPARSTCEFNYRASILLQYDRHWEVGCCCSKFMMLLQYCISSLCLNTPSYTFSARWISPFPTWTDNFF